MQDWTPVILRSASASASKAAVPTSKNPHVTRSAAAQTAASIEKKEFGTLKTLSAESRKTLIAKRVALKLNQVQLNQRCSFPPNTIRDFENGSLCPSNGQLNLLNRILGGGLHLG
jgi:ribosome-binding protein aMBF1 (putative translation factor)